MMGVIEAGERLSAISDGAVSAATLEAQHRQRHVDQLQRMRDGDQPRPRAAPATPAILASMGIGIVSTPSAPPERPENDG